MKAVWNVFKKIVESIENLFMVYLFLLDGLFIIVDITLRFFGIQGFSWIEEASRYLLVITTLLGSSIAVSAGGHMLVDLIYTLLPKKWEHGLKCITNTLCCLFCGYLSYYGIYWTTKLREFHRMASSVKIPVWYVWIPVCFALVSMTFRFLRQVWIEGRRAMGKENSEAPVSYGGENLE